MKARSYVSLLALAPAALLACTVAAEAPSESYLVATFAATPGTIDPADNAAGRDLDTACPTSTTAPLSPSDLVAGVDVLRNQIVVTPGSGGSAVWSGLRNLVITGASVTLDAPTGKVFQGVGFYFQNKLGALTPGGPANVASAEELLLRVEALDAANNVVATLKSWSYQGLRSSTSALKFDRIGVPEGYGTASTTEDLPAYFGVVRKGATFSRIRLTVLNPEKIAGNWSVQRIRYSETPGNTTCWSAGDGVYLVSDTNDDGNGFTHVLRTENHPTHAGHTVGHYWEINRYADPQVGPASGSILEGSGLLANLTSPLIQLRNPPADKMCDVLGQGDWLGLYHWSHFHFQGFHETDDAGFHATTPFDYDTYCAPGAADSPYAKFCDAYACCLAQAPVVNANGAPLPMGPALAAALSDPVCGAGCIQTMQIEQDACLGSPAPSDTTKDQRLSYYSLNNGRTWRRANHMNNRYHNGYPGEWHYNHAHLQEDGDGMLGTHSYASFDWDQDSVAEASSGDPAVDQAWDKQFGYLTAAGVMESPAMRVRFSFEERGTEPCQDVNGDGYCAGWRIDDVALDYNEECVDNTGARFYDTLGDTDTTPVGLATVAAASCAVLQSLPSSCTPIDTSGDACYATVTATTQHDLYTWEQQQGGACDPVEACHYEVCSNNHGVTECWPAAWQSCWSETQGDCNSSVPDDCFERECCTQPTGPNDCSAWTVL